MNNEYITFGHAIINQDGLYYRGTAYGDDRDWSPEKREWCDGAFKYTEEGAYKKSSRFPAMFEGCSVVRI